MLGMKLMVTGLLLVLTANIFIKAIGKYPGLMVGLPIVFAWIGGAAMQ